MSMKSDQSRTVPTSVEIGKCQIVMLKLTPRQTHCRCPRSSPRLYRNCESLVHCKSLIHSDRGLALHKTHLRFTGGFRCAVGVVGKQDPNGAHEDWISSCPELHSH